MIIDINVWLTYLENTYISFEGDTDAAAPIHNYNLMSYEGASCYKALQDYAKDATLCNYETITFHHSTVKENKYIKF